MFLKDESTHWQDVLVYNVLSESKRKKKRKQSHRLVATEPWKVKDDTPFSRPVWYKIQTPPPRHWQPVMPRWALPQRSAGRRPAAWFLQYSSFCPASHSQSGQHR